MVVYIGNKPNMALDPNFELSQSGYLGVQEGLGIWDLGFRVRVLRGESKYPIVRN